MRQLLISILCFCVIVANAQTKGNTSSKGTSAKKTATTQIEKKTDEELAIEKAQIWFKDNVVEPSFKDPYSYRVVGIKAVPISLRESLDILISKVKERLDACTVSPSDRTPAALDDIKKEVKDCEDNMALLYDKTDVYSQKRYAVYAKYKEKFSELAKKVELYLLDSKEYDRLILERSSMSEEQLDSFAYYNIHLDCYSKNEIGNEVLGRFVFPFTKDGVVVDDKTTLLLLKKIN